MSQNILNLARERDPGMKNVVCYGAKGDGVTDDTAAVQQAINSENVVEFPDGTYRCGTLYLRDNTELKLSAKAVIMAIHDTSRYNQPDYCPQNRASKAEKASGRHLISAVGVRNITIEGGCFDGDGVSWMERKHDFQPVWLPSPERPSQMLFFCECKNIRIHNTRFQNASYWHCLFHGCEDVQVSGVTVRGNHEILNDDGFDIDCCNHVEIKNCDIETGDDAIAIRGNPVPLTKPRPCENIHISDCKLFSAYATGVRFGVGNGEIRDCLLEHLNMWGAKTGFALVSKWGNGPNDGTRIHRITVRDIRMSVKRPFLICLDNQWANISNLSGAYSKNVLFENIRGHAAISGMIHGNGKGEIRDITFRNMFLEFRGKGPAPTTDENGLWCVESTDSMFEMSLTENIRFEKTELSGKDCWKYELRDKGSKGLFSDNIAWRIDKAAE